jgi:hypothetical protein
MAQNTQGETLGSLPNANDNDSIFTPSQREQTHRRWNMAVRSYVSTELFRYVQFVNRERDIEFGSAIQKIVCKACNIPTPQQQQYWNSFACDEVLEVLRRKRQSVAMSMKNRFSSK